MMSAAFTTQLTFDWASHGQTNATVVPAFPKSDTPVTPRSESKKLVRKEYASGNNIAIGVPAKAKPIEDILADHRANREATTRRNRPEHISDLLLVVLDRYGISPDEFLATLKD